LLIIVFLLLRLQHSISTLVKYRPVFIGLPLIFTNLLFTSNPLATLSWFFHLILYLLFFLSLSSSLFRTACYALLVGVAFQVVLGGLQVALGHSLQGIFYYFGERFIAVGSPAVATGTFWGQEFLRAYGTFGHPNVLAGWLVTAFLIYLSVSGRTYYQSLPLTVIFAGLTSLGVFLTDSRTAALALFGLVFPLFLFRRPSFRLIYFLILLCVLGYVLPTNLFTQRFDLSLNERLALTKLSVLSLFQDPSFGTGAQASITRYPTLFSSWRLLQPDHNSFSLFLSWFGLFGSTAFIFTLRRAPFFSSLSSLSLLPLLPLLALAHYLLTSPQGLFILLFYFRVTMSHES